MLALLAAAQAGTGSHRDSPGFPAYLNADKLFVAQRFAGMPQRAR